MRLIQIHVGLSKTGAAAIQHRLARGGLGLALVGLGWGRGPIDGPQAAGGAA